LACSRDLRRPSGAERDRAGRIQLRAESPTPRLRCDRSRRTSASRDRPTDSAPVAHAWSPSPVGSGPAIERRGIPLPPLPPLAGGSPVVPLREPCCDHDAMLELRRVHVVAMDLEYPTFWPAIHRYEPGSLAELRPSTRHWSDSSAIPATLVDELDRSQHVDLAGDTIPTAPDGNDPPPGASPRRPGVTRHVDRGKQGYSVPAA
jgi:hypothetical protein